MAPDGRTAGPSHAIVGCLDVVDPAGQRGHLVIAETPRLQPTAELGTDFGECVDGIVSALGLPAPVGKADQATAVAADGRGDLESLDIHRAGDDRNWPAGHGADELRDSL